MRGLADPTVMRLRRGVGQLATSAVQRMDERLDWYRALQPQERTWVGMIAQAGISQFVTWYDRPGDPVRLSADVFGAAPRELTRSISLQQTLDLLRTVVDVIEEQASLHVAPGAQQAVREAVLRYSRDVAFAAAQIYARAAESRGAWDARLEALVVDSLVRGGPDAQLHSHAAALGWSSADRVAVIAGSTPDDAAEAVLQIRRQALARQADTVVGVQDHRTLIVVGHREDPHALTEVIAQHLGSGHVVVGPVVPGLTDAGLSARSALSGLEAVRARPDAPRVIESDDLLPERLLAGDPMARSELIRRGFDPLAAQSSDTLLTTVVTYLAEGTSVEQCARALIVHPNTVRYRLRRVKDLTGWDPTDPRDAFVLRIAMAVGQLDQ